MTNSSPCPDPINVSGSKLAPPVGGTCCVTCSAAVFIYYHYFWIIYGDFSQVNNDKCSTIIMQMLIVNDFQIPSSWELWQMDYWPGIQDASLDWKTNIRKLIKT